MRVKGRIVAASVGGALILGAAACSSHPHHTAVVVAPPAAVSYAPAAYGVQVGSVFDCYYLDDPAEALALIQSGLCPAGAVPTLMPLLWHEQYYDYYASPVYYNTYVPVRYRTVWVSQQSTFYRSNKAVIIVQQKNATYKGSNGKAVTGSQLGTKPSFAAPTLSGGNRVAPTLGGGNARVSAVPSSVPKPAPSLGGGNARVVPSVANNNKPQPPPVVPR